MLLPDTFDIVRPEIVAFISRMVAAPKPVFPSIIGTGFFVDEHGLVVTNRHVAEAFESTPPHPQTGAHTIAAIVFRTEHREDDGTAMGMLCVDVETWWPLSSFQAKGPWYGEDIPDIAFVQIKASGTPRLTLGTSPNTLRTGVRVATAGFPRGETPLTLHGKVTQLTPMLRSGIVSSVFPFKSLHPHGFSIDVMSQGGQSGSPVFLESDPVVLGMISSGFDGTNMTFAEPASLIHEALEEFKSRRSAVEQVQYPNLESLVPAEVRQHEKFTWESWLVKDPNTIDQSAGSPKLTDPQP